MRVEIQPKSNDAKFEASIKADPKMTYSKDDLECEFCEALVKHVREILVSNTTEEEFKQVLQSLCKQTGSFAEQVFYRFSKKEVARFSRSSPFPSIFSVC